MLDSFFNTVLGPLMKLPEPFPIIAISFLITMVTTLVYKYATDQEVMKTLKEDMKAMQAEMKGLKDQPDKLMSMQKQAMEKNMKYMMKSFKPMLITFLPVIIFFSWLNKYYAAVGKIMFTDTWGINWIWLYIISSLVFSMAMRKILKVY